jgi:hypothetical protein
MNHRRAYSDGDIDDAESVSDTESVKTVQLYYGWKMPEVEFSVKLPGWFIVMVTLFIFKGPTSI